MVERLTKNIYRHEIACKCGCGLDSIDHKVVEIVQDSCDHFAIELGVRKVVCHILSGARCDWWNGHEDGTRGSFHPQLRAIDYRIDGVSHERLYAYLCKKHGKKYGFGLYPWGCHADSRSGKGWRSEQ